MGNDINIVSTVLGKWLLKFITSRYCLSDDLKKVSRNGIDIICDNINNNGYASKLISLDSMKILIF